VCYQSIILLHQEQYAIVEQADLMEAIKYPLSNWNNYHNNMIRGAYHREILMPIINSIIDGVSIYQYKSKTFLRPPKIVECQATLGQYCTLPFSTTAPTEDAVP